MKSKLGFLFASANTPWVYGLAEKLAQRGNSTAAVTLHDWYTYRTMPPKWPNAHCPEMLKRFNWVFPTGYMGALEPVIRPIIRTRWRRLLRHLREPDDLKPWIICPYPWLIGSLRNLSDERLIYFNLDDYQLYRPERSQRVTKEEDELVRRSRAVFCLAQTQVNAFRRRFPERAADIFHLPLATPDEFLNPQAGQGFRQNTVGYVGNLIDRVDWRLVSAIARLLPHVEFIFVGYSNVSSGGGQRINWLQDRDKALRLPNVRQVDAVPQNDVAKHYWSFALTWIPYATDHVFNYGSCPTKIMDGLASGRPVLSTSVPECRLYPEWIHLMHSVEEGAAMIESQLKNLQRTDAAELSRKQIAFVAQNHTWENRAILVQKWLSAFGMTPVTPSGVTE